MSAFCTRRPAVTPMVVGREAAQTPSRLSVRSSISDATTSGGAHSKHAVRPGEMNWMCPETCVEVVEQDTVLVKREGGTGKE